MRMQAVDMFSSSHKDCLRTWIALGVHSWVSRTSLSLFCLPHPYGQVGKLPRLHLPPLHPPAQVEKKAALTVPSSQLWKAAFYSARDPQCREIRSLWLSTERLLTALLTVYAHTSKSNNARNHSWEMELSHADCWTDRRSILLTQASYSSPMLYWGMILDLTLAGKPVPTSNLYSATLFWKAGKFSS